MGYFMAIVYRLRFKTFQNYESWRESGLNGIEWNTPAPDLSCNATLVGENINKEAYIKKRIEAVRLSQFQVNMINTI
jgi:hypothetical protein